MRPAASLAVVGTRQFIANKYLRTEPSASASGFRAFSTPPKTKGVKCHITERPIVAQASKPVKVFSAAHLDTWWTLLMEICNLLKLTPDREQRILRVLIPDQLYRHRHPLHKTTWER